MPSRADSLALFHPLIAEWFRAGVGTPTDVQTNAWPVIADGAHALITAPTGSGKTLTAFLWALNQLITGAYPRGATRVLYISPLKALNNDIQRNLLHPLNELRQRFEAAGEDFPAIRVMTRAGDTPADERRAMLRKPPEILITTPESLNLLISSAGGRGILGGLQTVILDEIHSVIDSKRGTHLMTAVERLTRLSGEFQRIACSATVRPLELVAEFVGGYQRLEGERYQPRPVRLVQSQQRKDYRVQVRYPDREIDEEGMTSQWPPVVRACKEIVQHNRSTLIFTNARRQAENLTWKLNTDEPELLAYAHHGSLSREIRAEVERRLKAGRLRAIVATSSLEMGIDIGALDEVVLIQAPPGIASAIQRVGRAGHQVGETSRASLFPLFPHDLLDAAVLARNILTQNIGAARAVRNPLDVLAQILVSMATVQTWDIDDLYAEVRCSYAFHTLSRTQFDLVLEMLAGRYADSRVRELTARLSLDKLDNTVSARPGAQQSLYVAGGTIPDRGAFHLRHQESGALIGELDEEYVWEANIGKTLTFGTQNWRIERITHNDVFVSPAPRAGRAAPFWKAEDMQRDGHYSAQVSLFLEEANTRLEDPDFLVELQRDYCLEPAAAEALLDYLRHQRELSGCDLPHRHHLLVEQVAAGPDGHTGSQLILHTGWGGRVNYPFSLALAAAWEERFGGEIEIYPANDALYLLMPGEVTADELMTLVTSQRLDELLRARLESSGYFGARFRECAGRAMLVTRRKIGERMPLWVSRLRAKRLLEAVRRYGDFPIILETWRTCLQDEFDLDRLRGYLVECETGQITWSEIHRAAPTPFAATMSWRQINMYMYEDDAPRGQVGESVRADLLQEVVFTPDLRPAIPDEVIARFEAKRQRTAPGYAPQSARDLLDWVKERLAIPQGEWESLLVAIHRDHGLEASALLAELAGKLECMTPAGATTPLTVAVESLPRLQALWDDDQSSVLSPQSTPDSALLAEWLRCYGPVGVRFVGETLGIPASRLLPVVDDLLDTQLVIQGQLRQGGAEDDLCDSENFEMLLRMARAAATPDFAALPAEQLPRFLAQTHGLCQPGERAEELARRVEQLSAYPAKAELWEAVILPARMNYYDPAWLDSLLQEGHLHWVGAEGARIAFTLEDDLALLGAREAPADTLRDLLPDDGARYPLHALAMKGGQQRMPAIVARLWAGVWQGMVSNDSALTLRRAIAQGFKTPELPAVDPAHGRRVPRGGFQRWSAAAPFSGNWYRLPLPTPADDLLEEEERAKDRARVLLARHGLLFRELLLQEAPAFQWSAVFRAPRLMELAGEVLGGCFFHGIPGLQFISHAAFRQVQRRSPARVWWLNACDPASLCGTPLTAFRGTLPRRLPGNYLVYHGSDPVLFVLRGGKELQCFTPADDPRLPEYFAPLHTLLERRVNPEKRLLIDTINGEPAPTSPYLSALSIAFDVVRETARVYVAKKLW